MENLFRLFPITLLFNLARTVYMMHEYVPRELIGSFLKLTHYEVKLSKITPPPSLNCGRFLMTNRDSFLSGLIKSCVPNVCVWLGPKTYKTIS